MALSVMKDRSGPDWPLGVVVVATPGTPVNIMVNVDPSNNNAPGTTSNNNVAEYTPRCHKVLIQGLHAAANNNGAVFNSGFLYVTRTPAGGAGGRADSGCWVQVIPQGGSALIPADEVDLATLSPYRYFLDADTAGDGGLVTLVGCE